MFHLFFSNLFWEMVTPCRCAIAWISVQALELSDGFTIFISITFEIINYCGVMQYCLVECVFSVENDMINHCPIKAL